MTWASQPNCEGGRKGTPLLYTKKRPGRLVYSRDGACPVLVPCPRPRPYILLSSDVAVTGIRSEEIKAQKIHKPLQIAIVT